MKHFQHETISQSLAKQTVQPQIKPSKKRKGLSEEIILERCEEALKLGYTVNGDEVRGQHRKVIRSKVNNRLAITFRVYDEQWMIYQSDFIDFWNKLHNKSIISRNNKPSNDEIKQAEKIVEARLGYSKKDTLNLDYYIQDLKNELEDAKATIAYLQRTKIDIKSLKEIANNCN